MAHCTGIFVGCGDYRFRAALFEKLGTYDDLGLPGGVKQLLNAEVPDHREFIFKQIETYEKAHGPKNPIFLFNHMDCAAYGGSAAFKNRGEEDDFHIAELALAKHVVSERFPAVKVEILLGTFTPQGLPRVRNVG